MFSGKENTNEKKKRVEKMTLQLIRMGNLQCYRKLSDRHME